MVSEIELKKLRAQKKSLAGELSRRGEAEKLKREIRELKFEKEHPTLSKLKKGFANLGANLRVNLRTAPSFDFGRFEPQPFSLQPSRPRRRRARASKEVVVRYVTPMAPMTTQEVVVKKARRRRKRQRSPIGFNPLPKLDFGSPFEF